MGLYKPQNHSGLVGEEASLLLLSECRFGRAGDGPGSNPGTGKRIFSSPKPPDRLWVQPVSNSIGTRVLAWKKSCRGVKLTHILLVPRVRTSVAVPLLSLYAFMTWAGKALLYFPFYRLPAGNQTTIPRWPTPCIVRHIENKIQEN